MKNADDTREHQHDSPVHRRLSHQPQTTSSKWRHPSFTKRKDVPQQQPASQTQALRERDDDTTAASDKDSECGKPVKAIEEQAARRALRAVSTADLRPPSALVPDSLPVQPLQDILDAAPFRTKYNLYNPVRPTSSLRILIYRALRPRHP